MLEARYWLVVAFVSLACGCGQAVAGGAAQIEWDSCPTQAQAFSAARMQCGWLNTGDTLAERPVRLRVVVLRNDPRADDAHPLIYVPGGPGSNAGLDAASLKGWRSWQQRVGWHHDIVLFDPRGTGESRPRPTCDKRDGQQAPVPPLRAATGFNSEADAALHCYRALGPATAAQLGPTAQLRDLAHLIKALDATGAQLWGVSYGTRIARLFAARHPERVQTLILDSMFPFEQDDLLALPAQIGGALEQLDTRCKHQGAACESMPSAQVEQLLAQYERTPPTLMVTAGEGRAQPFTVTPYRLLLMILFSTYDRGNAADTRVRLVRALDGDPQALAPLADRLRRQAQDEARNEAVFWSTRCAFGGGVPQERAWRQALSAYPALARYLAPARGAPVCDQWQVPRLDAPGPDAAVNVPTLVVAGRADTVTPSAWATRFVRTHPQVRLVRVKEAAHAVTFSNACAQLAVSRFLDDSADARMPDCDAPRDQSGR
ncbi:alpha/beta hydrolase [Salinisphaera aquimarina]|uniref:Alpha/beta hydrolase n=1 Tax=Salinisphaera aquimarina TaxID=2094031 RepID=A0ABV7ESL5_9GAMM